MQQIKSVIMEQPILDIKIPIRIAFIKPDGMPSIISLWYKQIDGKIYCATKRTAKIVTYLQNNPKCGFEIASDKPPYRGTRGTGHVKIIESQGPQVLKILMKKYLENKESTLSKYLKGNLESEVALEISPKNIFNYDYSKRMKGINF